MSHYEVLGVSRRATQAEIKKAYRKLASQHHTDRDGGDHDRMAAINKAYETLYDPEKRARYDATGDDGPRPKTPQEAAADVLAQVIVKIVSSDFEGNLVAELKRHFTEVRQKLREQTSAFEKKIAKLSGRRGSIRTKKETNLFHVIIDEQIAHLRQRMASNSKEDGITGECLTLLADYEDTSVQTMKSGRYEPDQNALEEALQKLFEQEINKARGYR